MNFKNDTYDKRKNNSFSYYKNGLLPSDYLHSGNRYLNYNTGHKTKNIVEPITEKLFLSPYCNNYKKIIIDTNQYKYKNKNYSIKSSSTCSKKTNNKKIDLNKINNSLVVNTTNDSKELINLNDENNNIGNLHSSHSQMNFHTHQNSNSNSHSHSHANSHSHSHSHSRSLSNMHSSLFTSHLHSTKNDTTNLNSTFDTFDPNNISIN